MLLFYLFFIFIVSFFLRILPRLINNEFRDYDTYFHLFFIEYIRKYGINRTMKTNRFIKESQLIYPWLSHLILSYISISKENMIKYEKYINPLIDTIYIQIIFLFTYNLSNSYIFSIKLVMLYLFTPYMFTFQSTGPRIYSLTTRLHSEILCSLIFVLEYFYFIHNNYIYLIIAILFVPLVFLTSKFSVQALFFISFISFLFNFDYEIILVPIIGTFVFILFLPYQSIKLIRWHYYHMKTFYYSVLRNKSDVSSKNDIYHFISLLKSKSYKKLYYYSLYSNTYLTVIIKYPIIVLYIILIIFQQNLLDYYDYKYIFSLSGILIYFIINLKPLLFLGEPERYINHIYFFILLTITEFLTTHNILFYILIIYGFIFYILDLYMFNKINHLNTDADIIINILKKIKPKSNIVCIPQYHIGLWRIVYETQHNVLHDEQWVKVSDRLNLKNYFSHDNLLDLKKINEIIKIYNIDIIIVSKTIVNNCKRIKLSQEFFCKEISKHTLLFIRKPLL